MLDVSGLRAGYGAINVLWDVDIHFAAGKLTTIIGPNGAGKTTLLRAIMGIVPLTAGAVTLNGSPLASLATAQRVDRGIALIPEGRMIFRDMNVEENLLLGAYSIRAQGDIGARLEQAYAMFPRLRERYRQLAGSLSGGEAQMLAMARGLMADPMVLLIDEPSLGLAPVVVQEIFDLLGRLKDAGRTIILVEQNTQRAVAIADRVYLLQGGKVLLNEAGADVDLETVTRLYFAR